MQSTYLIIPLFHLPVSKDHHCGGEEMLKTSEKKYYEKPVLEICGPVIERTLCTQGSGPYSSGSYSGDNSGIRNLQSDLVYFHGGNQGGIHGNGQGGWRF
jgi:hypothetical protein